MAGAPDPGAEVVDHLEGELRRLPADRHPVPHATARFHLGTVHLHHGRPRAAEASLLEAVRLFGDLPVERAKAVNMLGVARRTLGDAGAAAEAFADAEQTFRGCGQPLEEAAAAFNLGLVHVDAGEPAPAVDAFERARRRFVEGRRPAQASAASRELGAALLALGELEAAAGVLDDAMARADQAGDAAALGAAANVAGLVRLGLGRPDEAVRDLHRAVAAHPRSLRPAEHAMAKANLALAHEAEGDAPRARLAARQARGTPGVHPVVVDQADELLRRLPHAADDLPVVLVSEAESKRTAVLREELVRWLDASVEEQQAGAAALVAAHLSREPVAVDLAGAWLEVLVELPPAGMDLLVHRVVEALGERPGPERAAFRAAVARGAARFHVPQMLRLREAFEQASGRLGHTGSWT
jgi:tetratricopeptide (TPR) repeat protein